MKIATIILAVISVGLIIGGFYVPPTGVIDGSVISAVGELMGFGVLFMAWENIGKAIDKGVDTKFQHGNTSVSFNNPDNEDKDA